jgi:hypothetical protein
MNRTILLKGEINHEEAIASGVLSPGHLIMLDSAGKVLKHATQGGYAERLFATENALAGKSIDDAYAIGDVVPYNVSEPGDIVNALLAPAVAYAIGDQLISAGNGTLKKASLVSTGVTVKQIIGVVTQAIDLTAGGAVATCSPVRLV